MIYKFDVEWTTVAQVEVEADSREDAEDQIDDMSLEDMNGEYMDDSFKIRSVEEL